jgi:glycerol-3-phosphate dehydrogenase
VKAPQNVRLIKGSHFVVPKLHDQKKAYILQNEDHRIIFIIPYENDFSLIGTTDIEIKQDPSDVKISDDEIDYLINITNKHFKHKISRADIVHTYSGVRPLLDDESSSAQSITRDYTLEVNSDNGAAPLLSVFGGKITTYRKLAEVATNKIGEFLTKTGPNWTKTVPLPGGDFENRETLKAKLQSQFPWLETNLLERYIRSYGTLIYKVLLSCRSQSDMGQHYGAGLFQCELEYLIDNEWAQCADDILWRRTKLGLRMTALEKKSLAIKIEQLISTKKLLIRSR